MGELRKIVQDPDRVSHLFSLADEKVQLLEEKMEAFSETDEKEHIQQVQETFPAIDIKFLGRNKEYKPEILLDFKLGVYVFWEINELKFRYVSKYKILKPHYERKCYTLVQEVESLQYNRESVWKNHIAEENV